MHLIECYCLYHIRFAETTVRFFSNRASNSKKKINCNSAGIIKPNLEEFSQEAAAASIQRLKNREGLKIVKLMLILY
jgi:hypothetical protein